MPTKREEIEALDAAADAVADESLAKAAAMLNGSTAILSATDILNRDDRPAAPIDVPLWGGSVLCRPLTLKEQAAHAEIANAEPGEGETDSDVNTRSMCAYLVRALVDKNKLPLFTDKDLDELWLKNGAVIQTVFKEAVRLNGVGATSIADAEKN